MKQNFKRFLSWTLALLMALSLLPAGLLSVPAYAEELVDELVNDAQAEEFTVQATRVAVTFLPPKAPGCSFNADNQNFSKDSSQKPINGNSIQVQVFPAAGYRFLGWYYVTNSVVAAEPFSTETDGTLTFEQSCTVTARFATQDTATFKVGNKTFTGLQAAIDYAQGNGETKITLASDGSIYGDYTIPAGITLLIPFDEAGTVDTNAPGYIQEGNNYVVPSVFRKLTMEEGASIIVEGAKGAISVGGKHYTCSQAQCCKTTGPYGQIQMEAGSSITLKNGAKLYAWGYITGDGQITANSGAEVYEYFQIMDWRGGSCTSDMEGNEKKVFPFSQYYVQNIEAELTIQNGATEYAYLSVTATLFGKITKSVKISYVGENGLFSLGKGASLTKKYDPKNDCIIFKIMGDAELSEIQLKMRIGIFDFDFKSSAYVLPINNNVDMQILSGTTTVSKDAALLPGVTMSIAKGAELKVADSASLYVYDADQWRKTYVQGSNELGISPVVYSPSDQGSRTVSDATIDVNGTLTAAGAIYTTEGGANICSSKGTGVYVQQGQLGKSSETYQCIQNGKTPNYTAIPITPAKLRNGDGSYVETRNYPQGSEIKYEYNAWGGKPAMITVTFDANGGEGTMSAQSGTAGQNITLPSNCFTYEDHTFTGWNTAANGTGTPYDDEATAFFTEDTTLYAQWTQKPVVTFSANGGDGSMSPQTVEPNAATTLIPNAFTRADYDFTGWNTAADGSGTAYADRAAVTLSGNCTLYAQWTLHKYRVRWLNWDRSVLQEGYYTCEETAAWDDGPNPNPTPTRPEDENYTYKFANRWVPYSASINGWGFNPHQDVDFTAQFNQFEKLTVTFDAGDGSGTMDSVKIPNGSTDTYYTLPACGFTAPQGKLFDGWLITGTVGYSAFDKYELSDEKWDEDEAELLAFSDLTLKASWTVSKYTITFDTDGGSGIASITQDYGTAITAPADPTKTGYTFNGWNPAIPETMPAENRTVKATWTANQYTITFDTAGGSVLEPITQDYGTAITAPTAPTKTGYTFNGWEPAIPATMPAENRTVKATWTINQYTITFDTDVGSEIAPITQDYGTTIIAPAAPTKTGYTFGGWDKEIPGTMPAENVTVKATWKANTYTVHFDTNGGSACDDITVTFGQTYGNLPTPEKAGYAFAGWYAGETPVTAETMVEITANQTLTAHWNAKGNTPYTVEYYQQNLADNDYTKVEEKSLSGQTDSTVEAEIFNYTGFTVNNEKSTTSGTVAGDGRLVLKVYYDRNTYQITWVIDGRKTSATYRYGATPTAPAAEKAADNSGSYTFTGWDKTLAPVTEDARYTAQFRKKYDAVIGETTYRTVALALEAAKTGETVTVQDGAVITESTQVPAGVLLLVPCMADDTGYSQRAGSEYYNPNGTAVEPALGANGTRYCILTVAEGAALTVRGTLLVNAVTGRPQAGHLDQDINGGYSELQLNGTITVEQGGIFDSCGYTKGNGRITANAGGTVRDLYVVRSWRGGSHAAVMYENKIYPMNEYDMHNITAPIRIYAGAVLEGTVKMYAGGMFSYTRFMQIGESNGLIRLAEGAYADRTYDAKTARVCYTLSGGAAFSSSEMQISGVQVVSTGDYYFPVDGDIDLVLEKGAYSINNDLKLLTGSTLTVNGDAALTVKAGANLIAYQQFHDPENTGDTQYPERPAAKILLKNGAVWTVNGGFAGKLTLDETEGSRAVVALAAEAATELSSREANGYQKSRKEPVYQEIKECAVMEENTALTAGMQYSFVRRNGKVCAENGFEAVESSGAFRLLASAAAGSRVIAAGYDAQGKMTGVSVLVLSAPSMSGTVTLPKGSWTQLRYFLLSPENAPVCEMCSCAR